MSVSNCQNLNGLNKKQTNKKNTPPCGSTRRRRWPRSVRWGPTPRPRPCSARLCSSRCSLTCPRRPELRSNCRQFRHTRFLETVEEKDGRERGWKHSDLRAELESGAELSYEVSETVRFVISGCLCAFHIHRERAEVTDLLSPASTKNCPCGLQKILLACCLSNISAGERARLIHTSSFGQSTSSEGARLPFTHSEARSCRCSWRSRRKHWSWETLRGGRQTCCRSVPRRKRWCFL